MCDICHMIHDTRQGSVVAKVCEQPVELDLVIEASRRLLAVIRHADKELEISARPLVKAGSVKRWQYGSSRAEGRGRTANIYSSGQVEL